MSSPHPENLDETSTRPTPSLPQLRVRNTPSMSANDVISAAQLKRQLDALKGELRAKNDAIAAKDDVIKSKDAEIDRLRREVEACRDLINKQRDVEGPLGDRIANCVEEAIVSAFSDRKRAREEEPTLPTRRRRLDIVDTNALSFDEASVIDSDVNVAGGFEQAGDAQVADEDEAGADDGSVDPDVDWLTVLEDAKNED